jgi:hypothetical protein
MSIVQGPPSWSSKKQSHLSGYKLFCGIRMQELRQAGENEKYGFGELTKKIAKEWCQLDEKVKNEYSAISDCMKTACKRQQQDDEMKKKWLKQLEEVKLLTLTSATHSQTD